MNKKKHICFKKYTSKNCVISELQELQETSTQTTRILILILKKNGTKPKNNKKEW